MKTRLLLLIAISAIGTLSFSFGLTNKVEPKEIKTTATTETEPIGGFVSEDKF